MGAFCDPMVRKMSVDELTVQNKCNRFRLILEKSVI